MNIIDLPPYAPTLIESTRAIGYTLKAAVADIVDNSIAADASRVDISFFPASSGTYISILDNGIGMNSDELTQAMQYGSKSPLEQRGDKDLGRFGLGLKTASLSQCKLLTVVTKQGKNIFARAWDIDYVRDTGRWSLISIDDEEELSSIPNIDQLKKLNSGTLVVWQKLDRLEMGEIDIKKEIGRKFDEVSEHLSLVYHRYLSGETGIKKIAIYVNGRKLKPKDPFLEKESDRPMDDETFIINGSKIVVRPYILPHFSKLTQDDLDEVGGKEGLRKLQGFYVYRNKRLLVWGTWFRMQRKGELTKLARIRVDIPNSLDDLWTLDIKKSSAMPPAEVRKNLANIIDKIASQSKRKYTFRGKREINDRQIHVWNRLKSRDGGYYYEINEKYPMIETLIHNNPESKQLILSLLKQIEIGLPLNQIYVDLNNDTRLENDRDVSASEIENSLRAMIAGQPKKSQIEMLNTMEMIEPFSFHEEIINKIKEEIENNVEQ